MIHRFLSAPLIGVALAGVMVCCATTTARAQAPGRKPQVVQFAPSETARDQNNEVVNVSAEEPWDSRHRLAGLAADEIERNPTWPAKARIYQFGQATRNDERHVAAEPRRMGSGSVVDDVSFPARQTAAAKRLLAEAKQAAVRGDTATAQTLARRAASIPATWDLRELTPKRLLRELEESAANQEVLEANQDILEANPADAEFEPAVADLVVSKAPQPLRGSASTGATYPDSWTSSDSVPTLPARALDRGVAAEVAPLPSDEPTASVPVIPAADAILAPQARTAGGQAAVARRLSPVAKPEVIDIPVHDVKSSAGTAPAQLAASVSPIQIDLSLNLLLVLIGGLVLLVGVLFCALIVALSRSGHRREAVVKIDITNNGSGAGTVAATSGESQSVTLADLRSVTPAHSQPVASASWQPAAHGGRVPPNRTAPPVAPAYWPPAAQAYSPPAAQADWQPAAPADSRLAVPPLAPQIAPVYATKKQRTEELQQQQEAAMVRQVFEENVELRQQIVSKQNRAA